MRIVHTCLRYPPSLGGAETYVREIVERTRNIPGADSHTDSGDVAGGAGILNVKSSQENRSQNLVGLDALRDVRVLTSKMRTHHPISELDPELLLDDPMYVQRLHHAATPIFAYPRLQALKYYIGHHQPDILHGYGFWYQPADVAARYAKKHNIPFIFHPLYYENENRQKLVWQLYKNTVGKKTFTAADVVVVISPFEQKLIEKAFQPAPHRGAAASSGVKRFELIPPGVDTTKFDRLRLNPYIKKGIHGKTLLTVSRVSPGKGLEELLGAFPSILKQVPEAQLVVVGEDFGIKDSLQREAEDNRISNQVHFWGKVDEEILIAAYQHADLFLHPSHYEAFGIVIAEALAAGTPVVARNSSAIPFVSPHDRTGLLFNTSEELIQQTVTLLQSNLLREKFGQAGMRHVQENFTWDKSIAKVLKLYEELSKK